MLLTVRDNEKKLLKLTDDCIRLGWSVRALAVKAGTTRTVLRETPPEEPWKPKGQARLVKKLGFKVLVFAQGDVNRMELNGLTKAQVQKICDLLDRESAALTVKAPAAKKARSR